MSSTSLKNSLFSIEPYTLSNYSLFSIKEYNHGANQMSQHEESKSDAGKSHASFISIDQFNSGGIHQSEDVPASERVDSFSDGVCVNKPIHFRRIPRQAILRRYSFLCSDHQITFDASKPCCGNICLTKFGKANLRGLRQKYLSLNGDEQDIYMISHMQLVHEHTARASSVTDTPSAD